MGAAVRFTVVCPALAGAAVWYKLIASLLPWSRLVTHQKDALLFVQVGGCGIRGGNLTNQKRGYTYSDELWVVLNGNVAYNEFEIENSVTFFEASWTRQGIHFTN